MSGHSCYSGFIVVQCDVNDDEDEKVVEIGHVRMFLLDTVVSTCLTSFIGSKLKYLIEMQEFLSFWTLFFLETANAFFQ